MKSSREMRREAWDMLKGKWFWRLLCVGAVLQLVVQFANGLVAAAFKAVSITSVEDFLAAKISAAQQGLSYSLPTAKAYGWMVGGFCFQMFIAYIFAAIAAFGFMGLLLKTSRNDDSRWFADAFGGFARPLEITWLLVLMNLLTVLPVFVCGLVAGVSWAGLIRGLGPGIGAVLGVAVAVVAVGIGVICALAVMYGYRQAWFIKNERPETSALGCLGASRRMMNGFKWRAFCLDFSFLGWLFAVSGLVAFAVVGGSVASNLSQPAGVLAAVAAFGFGIAAFWLFIRVILGMAVARVVFYRELVAAREES